MRTVLQRRFAGGIHRGTWGPGVLLAVLWAFSAAAFGVFGRAYFYVVRLNDKDIGRIAEFRLEPAKDRTLYVIDLDRTDLNLYDNAQSAEGRAFVYHGSSSGLALSPAWTAESDQAAAFFAREPRKGYEIPHVKA